MDIQEFVAFIHDQLDNEDVPQFEATTVFKEVDGWSSLTALTVMMTVAEKYGKMLTADEIRQSNTIEDLFKVVEAYQK
jgi:acyl carrier protein